MKRIVKLAVIIDRIQILTAKIIGSDPNYITYNFNFSQLGFNSEKMDQLIIGIKEDEILNCDLIVEKPTTLRDVCWFEELLNLVDLVINGVMEYKPESNINYYV